jgi:hypothetical protein
MISPSGALDSGAEASSGVISSAIFFVSGRTNETTVAVTRLMPAAASQGTVRLSALTCLPANSGLKRHEERRRAGGSRQDEADDDGERRADVRAERRHGASGAADEEADDEHRPATVAIHRPTCDSARERGGGEEDRGAEAEQALDAGDEDEG